MMLLIKVRKMGWGKFNFRSIRTCQKRAEILYWRLGKLSLKKNDQHTRTPFLTKYGGLYIYDIGFEKIYFIDDEEIHFVKGYKYASIVNPDHPYGTSTDHEYFGIHDDLFDRIL